VHEQAEPGQRLLAGAGRDNFLASAVTRMAGTDPQAAAAQLKLLPPAQQSAAACQIARASTKSDPSAAAQWAAKLSEECNVRGHAYSQMLEDWVEGDPAAAGAWLQRLPAGQSRDTAVSTFARRVRDTDPNAARNWIASSRSLTEEARVRYLERK
jgi:hypothetical protein